MHRKQRELLLITTVENLRSLHEPTRLVDLYQKYYIGLTLETNASSRKNDKRGYKIRYGLM